MTNILAYLLQFTTIEIIYSNLVATIKFLFPRGLFSSIRYRIVNGISTNLSNQLQPYQFLLTLELEEE